MGEINNRWRYGPLGLSAAFLIIILGRSLWLTLPGLWLKVSDPLVQAEAILPLAGEANRMRYAARLYADGFGQWILTTNPLSDTPGIKMGYGQLMRQEAELNGVLAEQIFDIEQPIKSTYEEALAVRLSAATQGW